MIPLCLEEGVGLIPWSPLARGFLAGNRNAESRGRRCGPRLMILRAKSYYLPASDFVVVDRLTENCEKEECTDSSVMDLVQARG